MDSCVGLCVLMLIVGAVIGVVKQHADAKMAMNNPEGYRALKEVERDRRERNTERAGKAALGFLGFLVKVMRK